MRLRSDKVVAIVSCILNYIKRTVLERTESLKLVILYGSELIVIHRSDELGKRHITVIVGDIRIDIGIIADAIVTAGSLETPDRSSYILEGRDRQALQQYVTAAFEKLTEIADKCRAVKMRLSCDRIAAVGIDRVAADVRIIIYQGEIVKLLVNTRCDTRILSDSDLRLMGDRISDIEPVVDVVVW